jgi:HK97 family phage major capsid protein/HK97 family phage prohead protease
MTAATEATMADRRVRRALEGDSSLLVTRVMALNDMEILSRAKGGDGRTVTAYAAAFRTQVPIVDSDGDYDEEIAPTAFNASLASGRQIKVFYNHGRTISGTPSDRGSVPIGTPAEPPRPDGRGLLTVTRYNKTPLADDVLESIRNGDITGQSFTGIFLQSDPERGPYRPSRNGQRALVMRKEIALIEYGPTPIPAYEDAAIVGVRNRELLMEQEEPQEAPPERTTVTIHVDQGAKARTVEQEDRADPPAPAGDESESHEDHPADGGEGQRTGSPAAPVQPGPPAKHPVSDENGKQGDTAMTDRQMTVEERAARQEQIRTRMAEIDTQFQGAALPDDARTEWDDLTSEMADHTTAIRDSNSRAAYLRTIVAQNPDAAVPGADQGPDARPESSRGAFTGYVRAPALNRGRPDNLYDVASARSEVRSIDDLGRVYRERAKWAIEEATFPGAKDGDAKIRERLEKLFTVIDDPDTLARNMLLTGSPEYQRAFSKMFARQSMAGLSQSERAALEMGTPASFQPGSYPVPFQLDPTVILTSNGAINALRTISRGEQIVGKEWLGVTSAGVTVSRGNELQVASDNTPTLAQPGVAPTKVQALVQFSIETEQDWNGLMAEVAVMLADAKDVEEATSFLTGAGTGDIPQGIITGISGTAQQVTTAGTASVIPNDVYALENALPPRFIDEAVMLSSKPGYNAIRSTFTQLASSAGDPWSRPSQGMPGELLGYSAYQNSNMVGTLASSSVLLVLGDFSKFLIVDRIGMSIELVPHIFDTSTGLPMGKRGIYAMWRNSSQVLVPNAFRYLQVR